MVSELLLAMVLITSDVQVPNEQIPVLAVRQVALSFELLDTDEETWYFAVGQTSYTSDLMTVQYRYQRLKTAPRLEDFPIPPSEFCEDMEALAYRHRGYCEERCVLLKAQQDFWGDRAREHARRAAIWQAAREASRPQWTYVRRMALETLRDLLGEVDFYAGRLPLPIAPLGEIHD